MTINLSNFSFFTYPHFLHNSSLNLFFKKPSKILFTLSLFSISSNNTSSFNSRLISGSDLLSIHSYGLAIDINPKQNPYLTSCSELKIFPKCGQKFTNRSNIRPGMVESFLDNESKTVIDVFKENGFTIWGGDWNSPIDWHHFQLPRKECEEIALLTMAAQ